MSTATDAAVSPAKLRINSSHSRADRGLDAYMSPPEAVRALMQLERLPYGIWEPCCGDGTGMVLPLRLAGHRVVAADIADYGCPEVIRSPTT